MLCRVEMFGRVPVLRRIAAPHVPAFQAYPQVNPPISRFHAVFAYVFGRLAIARRLHVFTDLHRRLSLT